jgi:hypothetical protein
MNTNTFTITIAGPERHEGHAPYTYVVNAENESSAIKLVTDHVQSELETIDTVLKSCVHGAPEENCGFHWNYLHNQSDPNVARAARGARALASYKRDLGESGPAEYHDLKNLLIDLCHAYTPDKLLTALKIAYYHHAEEKNNNVSHGVRYMEIGGAARSALNAENQPAKDKIEELAKAIYEKELSVDLEGKHRPWVEGGNSLKQDEARMEAHRRLSA